MRAERLPLSSSSIIREIPRRGIATERDGSEHNMIVRTVILLAASVALFLLTACVRREPQSTVVQRLEAAGSGRLSSTSTAAILAWLQQHRALAVAAEEE